MTERCHKSAGFYGNKLLSSQQSATQHHIAQRTDALDVHDGLITRIKMSGSVRRAGHDHIARQQRGEARNRGDLLRNADV